MSNDATSNDALSNDATGAQPLNRRAGGLGRIVRYGFAGGLSALSHLSTTIALVELAGFEPALASAIGFGVSVVVSYVLQRWWVFRSDRRHREAVPLFLAVVLVAGTVNVVIVAVGTIVLNLPYVIPQTVALIVIPIVNYALNSLFTFRPRRER
jgi:putative flippase GtrA